MKYETGCKYEIYNKALMISKLTVYPVLLWTTEVYLSRATETVDQVDPAHGEGTGGWILGV